MFITALFLVTKKLKQSKYYSAIKGRTMEEVTSTMKALL
jgi:hypothetical protein